MAKPDLSARAQAMIDSVRGAEAQNGSGANPAKSEQMESRQASVPYSHEAMLALIIANQTWDDRRYAAHFGQLPSWFASILASNSFQQLLDPVRHEIFNPMVTATLEERFMGLTLQSLHKLGTIMNNPQVQDATVLKAAEIGVKALGLGQPKTEEGGKLPAAESLDNLADRLTSLLASKGHGKGMIESRTVEEVRVEAARDVTDVMLHELDATPAVKGGANA